MSDQGVSIIIPSFNGRRLLEANLPSLTEALASSRITTEVLVVDDGSADGTTEFLAEKYPRVTCLALEENVGFGRAVNAGLERSAYPLVYLMNNDIRAGEGFLEPLVAHFSDPAVFAASSKALDIDGRSIFSRMGVGLTQGRIKILRNVDGGGQVEASPTLFASAGHGLYHKERLLALGGFDNLYSPFYMEDVDRCWQAWTAGWKVIYEPGSVVVHDHQSTIGAHYSRATVERFFHRNEWLFNWKHIHDSRLWLVHVLFVPLLLVAAPLTGRLSRTLSFFQALGRMGALKESRRSARATRRLSEREVVCRVMAHQA